MPPLLIKICGVSDAIGLDAALDAGADMVGFVFFARSPRLVSPEQAAALAERAGARTRRVALTVDADDDALDAIVSIARPDMLQLHGSETPSRVESVRQRYGLPVMRALAIGSIADLVGAKAFDHVSDYLLFDAPASGADRPGGNGQALDWSLLRDVVTRRPWLLAGGLDADNVAAALTATDAGGLDVSSGVESAPGVKDPHRIAAFVAAARSAAAVDAGSAAL